MKGRTFNLKNIIILKMNSKAGFYLNLIEPNRNERAKSASNVELFIYRKD
jgi:hypothetical protein